MAVLLMGAAKMAHAANFASVNLDMTLSGSLSMSISGSTFTSFGAALATNVSSVTVTAITVVNDSAGITETYSLKSFDSTPWTLQDTAGADQFALRALFNTTRPALGDFSDTNDKLTLTDIAATTSGGSGKFEGDQSGAGVPGNNTNRSLWFKLFTPTSTSPSGLGSRSLTVSILAQ